MAKKVNRRLHIAVDSITLDTGIRSRFHCARARSRNRYRARCRASGPRGRSEKPAKGRQIGRVTPEQCDKHSGDDCQKREKNDFATAAGIGWTSGRWRALGFGRHIPDGLVLRVVHRGGDSGTGGFYILGWRYV